MPCSYCKRALFIWQKSPIHMAKEPYAYLRPILDLLCPIVMLSSVDPMLWMLLACHVRIVTSYSHIIYHMHSHIYIHIYTYTYIHIHVYIYISVYIHIHVYIYIYTHTHTHTHTCLCVCMCVCVCVCVRACVRVRKPETRNPAPKLQTMYLNRGS